jgi:hypothetical protein
MIRKVILLIILSLLLSSCENSTDVVLDLPYTEYTVVDAELVAGQVFKGVTLTHTLPLDEEFEIQKAEIKDAIMYMVENGVRVIPLHYMGDGVYKPVQNIGIKANYQYELFVSTGSKTIYSKTTVPDVPEVVHVTDVQNQYLIAEVTAKPGEAYAAAWILSAGGELITADDYFQVVTTDQYPAHVLVRSKDIPAPYNTSAYRSYLYIKVFAFDKAYKDYFITKTSSDQINNTFTAGGGTVAWNVSGDHTIGLFIGVAEGNASQP